MAKWGRRVRRASIPALWDDVTSVTEPEDKACLFVCIFFPPPTTTCPQLRQPRHASLTVCQPISKEELKKAIKGTSNTSAPGLSDVGY
jgi:hypothetical protein